MALWPNNYRTAGGVGPYRFVGHLPYFAYTPNAGSNRNRFGQLVVTASVPEGAFPGGAWVPPIKAGGMSAATGTAEIIGTLNLLSGGAIAGTMDLSLSGDGSLSLLVYLSSTSQVLQFNVPNASLANILSMAGTATVLLDSFNSSLSIIDPMGATFTCAFAGSADLRGILSMQGVFTNSGEVAPDYGGAVYVADWGSDAFIYPAGTSTQPVATLAAADAIAARYNLHDYYVKGSFTFTKAYSDIAFYGWGPLQFNKIDLNNQEITNCHFHECVVEGQLKTTAIGGSGWQSSIARVEFNQCYLQSITDLQGTLYKCQIDGPTSIAAGGWVSSAETVIEGDYTVFDMRSTSGTTVSMDMVSGWAQFKNATAGCLIELNVKGGEVTFDSSCSGGEYYLEGVGTLFNEGSMTKKENHFIWDEPLAYHTDIESTGEILTDIDAEVDELHKLQGLDPAAPMTVTNTSRTAGTIELEISTGGGGDVTVTRQP